MSSLTCIVAWSQRLACEVLRPGDLAVDLTAGKGRDTLALAQTVAAAGQIVAFDLQSIALDQAEKFLQQKGLIIKRSSGEVVAPATPGVLLVHACHSRLAVLVNRPCRVIMANLGYLPGGDRLLVTRPETTLSALRQALELLLPGGRLVVTVYPGHDGGAAESHTVGAFFSNLADKDWQVLRVSVANTPVAPFLLVAERKE